LVVLAAAIASFRLPKIPHAQHQLGEKVNDSIWKHPNLVFGAIAIFVYVGAEVSIGSFLVNYFSQPEIGGLSEKLGAAFVSFYWGGAMLGRFIGSNFLGGAKAKYMAVASAITVAVIVLSYPIQRQLPPGYQPGVPNLTWLAWLVVSGRPLFIVVAIATAMIAIMAATGGGKATANTGTLLGICALMTSLLVAISMTTNGPVAMWSIILVGLFNSIMFPSIFTLGIAGLGPLTGDGSGLLVMAIVGGAIIPVAQGWIADHIGIHHAFILPVICYMYIVFYAFKGSIPRQTA